MYAIVEMKGQQFKVEAGMEIFVLGKGEELEFSEESVDFPVKYEEDHEVIFGNEKKQWAGYTDFYVPVSENVESGMYELNYIDAQENVVSRIINLNYDMDFLKMTGNQAALAEKKDFREEIAVYSESGTLLFYGMRKNNWRNDSSIFSSNRGAASYRVCYVSKVNSLVLMMPPVYKNKENKENK